MKKSLVNNKWAMEEDLSGLDSTEIKDLLFGKLENFYDRNVHSKLDLNLRQEIGDKGSICGLAALYQAGVSTILSVSEIKQMSFDNVKEKIGIEAGFEVSNIKKQKDKPLLEIFYQKICQQNPIFKRRKRNIANLEHQSNNISSIQKKIKRQIAESEEELDLRRYGSKLRYECGLARKFYDPEAEEEYSERWMQCNWNTTWTLYDKLDECIWVQCLYPPDPPLDTLLASTWNGEPVEFHSNVSYVCESDDLYFEVDREMTEYNISCLPGGSWDEPDVWPVCFNCKLNT